MLKRFVTYETFSCLKQQTGCVLLCHVCVHCWLGQGLMYVHYLVIGTFSLGPDWEVPGSHTSSCAYLVALKV